MLRQVVLHTTFGDIDIELWSREAPKACRNFVQLALEGVRDAAEFFDVDTWCSMGLWYACLCSTMTTPYFIASFASSWCRAAILLAPAQVRQLRHALATLLHV